MTSRLPILDRRAVLAFVLLPAALWFAFFVLPIALRFSVIGAGLADDSYRAPALVCSREVAAREIENRS